MSKEFLDCVKSGRFMQIANEAIADAIAEKHALGFPVEGYLNSEPIPASFLVSFRAVDAWERFLQMGKLSQKDTQSVIEALARSRELGHPVEVCLDR